MKHYSKEEIIEIINKIFEKKTTLTLEEFIESVFSKVILNEEEKKLKNLFITGRKISETLSKLDSKNIKDLSTNSPSFNKLESLFRSLFKSMNITSSEFQSLDENSFDEDYLETDETKIN
ncbi:hypothetical protein [[Mycoplasma] mobile]|uniref:Expressed protein n=1 Tax=Mycoplasma mobile (strain ATCC 43663 / 163K / NCTC 11711) TaxID=267748 RepID=Q6KIG1_MYCM1|nr:hypothetical protein [[Mycoplasma] mobile]AAT27615.1 expressed protein [Mycoplasma mobile 163K]